MPVRVGLGRRQNKWLQITNANAGTLPGRSLGLQIQVLEWLVGVIFENHFDCAFDVVHIANQNLHFFLPLNTISLPWSHGAATIVQSRLTGMSRPFRFNRDLARAFP